MRTSHISFGQREGAGCYLDWIIPAMLSYPDKYTVSTVDATEFAARTAMDMAANDISKSAAYWAHKCSG